MASTLNPTLDSNFDPRLGQLNSTAMVSSSLHTNHLNDSAGDKLDHHFFISIDCCVQVVIFTVMVGICSLLGTVGNIPVLLVYCAKKERRTSNTFIKVLAIIDLVVCAIIMPYTIVFELHLVDSDIVCRLFEFIRHVSLTASNMTLVAIAIERYVAVCVIGRRLTVRNVHQGMLVVIGISVIMAVPSIWIFALVTKEDVKDVHCAFPHNFDSSFFFCHFTTSIIGPVLSTVYQTVLMVLFFVTFIIIVVIYTIVYSSLWKRSQRRSIMRSFRIDVEASSTGEKKKPRNSSFREDIEQENVHKDSQIHGELVICLGNCEAGDCSSDEHDSRRYSDEQVRRLAESGELNSWARNDDEITNSSGSAYGRVTATNFKIPLHRRTARMLFLCSIVFLVTWLPFWVDVFNHTHNLCLRYLFFVGNASNPLVYGISNSRFRRSFVKLLVSLKPMWSPCRQTERE